MPKCLCLNVSFCLCCLRFYLDCLSSGCFVHFSCLSVCIPGLQLPSCTWTLSIWCYLPLTLLETVVGIWHHGPSRYHTAILAEQHSKVTPSIHCLQMSKCQNASNLQGQKDAALALVPQPVLSMPWLKKLAPNIENMVAIGHGSHQPLKTTFNFPGHPWGSKAPGLPFPGFLLCCALFNRPFAYVILPHVAAKRSSTRNTGCSISHNAA